MYAWTIKLQFHWEQEKYWFIGNVDEFTVSAKTYEKALEKAEKLTRKKSFVDDAGKTLRVDKTRIISVVRGEELDA